MIVRKNHGGARKDARGRFAGLEDSDTLKNMVGEGVTTYDLEVTAEKMMAEAGARPAFKGYSTPSAGTKFPFVLCISVNDEIVHGMPSQKTSVEERRYCVD